MTDSPDSHGHGGSRIQAYVVVGVALAIFTAVSFFVNYFVRNETITASTGFAIILGVAVVKSALVGTYFMHLKYDWAQIGFMIVPALILGTMLFFVLMPDIVLAWR